MSFNQLQWKIVKTILKPQIFKSSGDILPFLSAFPTAKTRKQSNAESFPDGQLKFLPLSSEVTTATGEWGET